MITFDDAAAQSDFDTGLGIPALLVAVIPDTSYRANQRPVFRSHVIFFDQSEANAMWPIGNQ